MQEGLSVKKFSLMLAAAACTVALPLGTASAATVGDLQTAGTSVCVGSGPIPASDLMSGISAANCPLEGRLVVRSYGSSHVGVHVPAPGHAQGAVAATISGDYILTVTNQAGIIKASTSFPQSKIASSRASASPAAADPACSEPQVVYEGFVWNKTLNWYYNQNSVTRAGLSGPATLSAIRGSNTNLTTGVNNCGYTLTRFGAYLSGTPPLGAYQGTTVKYANINSSGDCLTADGQSTVSWGPVSDGDTLAYTCWDSDESNGTYFGTEADTYIASNMGIVTSFPTNCTSSYDLNTVMVHEWGHSYGLDEETGGPDLVMYQYKTPCAYRQHLGEGDWNGMADLYGVIP